MIRTLISAILHQRLVVLVVSVVLLGFGLNAAQQLAIDAFPDVTTVQVQVASEAPAGLPKK